MSSRSRRTKGPKVCRDRPAEAGQLTLGVNLLFYGRASSGDQDKSVPQQLEEFAKAVAGWDVPVPPEGLSCQHDPAAGILMDDGVSGWKFRPEERHGGKELLEFCEAHPQPHDAPGYIVIWALSRFGRFQDGAEEAFYYLHQLRRWGWRVLSLTEPGLDETNDEDRLMRVIRFALESERNTRESESKSVDVRRANDWAAEKGIWRGGTAPFGYRRVAVTIDGDRLTRHEVLPPGKRNGLQGADTLLEPNPSTAPTLRRVFELYAYGDENGKKMSLAGIARWLEAQGVATSEGGVRWYHTTVKKLLRNEAYIAIQRDSEDQPHEALWEPLVSKGLWTAVHEGLAGNAMAAPRGRNSLYIMTGLLFCAGCGKRLSGNREKSGDGFLYYYRAKQYEGECPMCRRRVRVGDLERPILEAVATLADRPEIQARVAQELKALRDGGRGLQEKQVELEHRLQELDRQIEGLLDVAENDGQVGQRARARIEAVNEEYQAVQEERELLEQRLAGRPGPASQMAAMAAEFTTIYENASAAERKELVRIFIARIEVDGQGRVAEVFFRSPDQAAA